MSLHTPLACGDGQNPRPVGMGQKVTAFFSGCGYVAYQIKGKEV